MELAVKALSISEVAQRQWQRRRENPRAVPYSSSYVLIKISSVQEREDRDFPGGAVDSNLPASAGNTGWSPGPGRSHLVGATKAFRHNNWALALAPASHSYWTHAVQPLKCSWSLGFMTRKATPMRSPWPPDFWWEPPPTPTRRSLHATTNIRHNQNKKIILKKSASWPSPVVQWLRICLPMQ